MTADVSRRALLVAGFAAACAPADAQRARHPLITGVNLAGLEFKSGRLPGVVDQDFVAPRASEFDYYAARGARAIRLPFLWERLQPELGGPFDPGYLALIDDAAAQARARGMRFILDPHQYGRRTEGGQSLVIGQDSGVTARHFAQFWGELAQHYRSDSGMIFALQNEPHDQDLATLVGVENAAIAAIREAGARQLILVSGGAWSGAHSWNSSGNAAAMLGIRDPANTFAFDVHQYLDTDSSGTHGGCESGASARLRGFTEWARAHGKRGFLGEFGAGPGAVCLAELDAMLSYLEANSDVWIGWTYWAGGRWWGDDYALSIEPSRHAPDVDRPQMAVLRRHFG